MFIHIYIHIYIIFAISVAKFTRKQNTNSKTGFTFQTIQPLHTNFYLLLNHHSNEYGFDLFLHNYIDVVFSLFEGLPQLYSVFNNTLHFSVEYDLL